MDMGTDMGQILIQSVGYGGTTTCTLPDPLTSLVVIGPISQSNTKSSTL